MQAQN